MTANHHDPEMPPRQEDHSKKPFGPQLVVLAAERTLLSWLRVCLALMGLGFILDRFGLFLRLSEVKSGTAWLPRTFTFYMGTGLVLAGAITSAAAGIIYAVFRLRFARQGYPGPAGSALLGLVFSILNTLIGIVTAVFLIVITD